MHERIADHPIDPLFLARWSPRAYDARLMQHADLLCLLEAARWAPSAYNHQPWRFLYARRDDAHWADFLDLLVSANGAWAQHAAALVFVLSDTRLGRDGAVDAVPSRSHSFDAGAAWAQLALQALRLGYHARAMAGAHRAEGAGALPHRDRRGGRPPGRGRVAAGAAAAA
ncbi:nitroreductase family protein [Ralstonia pseudosolanacearum]|uniref:nitroreductase family protein n=1 Tax=Ralstonia pseudosolanacearum TaxID=1310165 RepID=UPI0026768165|nr:nitroreductase family protein [Ralstonia pseudosolanacearum]MDO3508893.1 nitroreductase family protein [Ralstonia pseudosolanacearum]MDO3514161.1 nitroreductase family protein [Ralstonia pseudosolanacearum]MDO3538989.1 nitroreductase family protein [Ralstonia pseudosolanacearum]MDO3607049.1 nitroreductase family protein [Ralstonia pseudosolanacearum]MDO3612803.1 nitroreductase family protein [Ralstonia pseudosolanacearum]